MVKKIKNSRAEEQSNKEEKSRLVALSMSTNTPFGTTRTTLITPTAKYSINNGIVEKVEPVEDYSCEIAKLFEELSKRAEIGAFTEDYRIKSFGYLPK